GEHVVEAVLRNCPTNHNSQEDRCRGAAEMPRFGQRIALVNVSTDSVCLIAKHKSVRRSDLAEVFDGIDAHERSGRTVLFAGIRLSTCARRIQWSRLAEIALDGDNVVRGGWRSRRIDLEAQRLFQLRSETGTVGRSLFARRHRDGVVRTLRRAVETTDA